MPQKPTVLIVDDEAAIAFALERKLRSEGYPVCGSASSKEEAIALARQTNPDYIIMDIRLSGEGDGIDAAREILSTNDTNVIFITGYSEGGVKERAMELNPHAYLVKPVKSTKLISLMQNAHKGAV